MGTIAIARAGEWRFGPTLRKYASVGVTAIRQSLNERGALVGRMAFYAVILFIFSRLWEVVVERGAVGGLSMKELLWYLAVTEWVMLSMPLVHLQIEADVRRGDIAYLLPRPISYLAVIWVGDRARGL